MMKNQLLAFLFLLPYLIYGQSLHDLDMKNGFKHFKLGSSPSQNKDIRKKQNGTAAMFNAVSYEYIGDEINHVGGVKVVDVKLDFFNNKLTTISIGFGDFDGNNFTEEEYRRVRSFAENIYGREWSEPTTKQSEIINSSIWDANKVRMELNRMDFNKKNIRSEDKIITGYLLIFDKKLMREMISNNF